MCCFSAEVESVSNTHIFARSAAGNRQFLVYSMRLSARVDLAMVLPIPVPPCSPEDVVRFISLEQYPEFFRDMRNGFSFPRSLSVDSKGDTGALLKVVQVGKFEASFVPTVGDFARLDPRFRLPEGVWDDLPSYSDYGFTVFKLRAGSAEIHPMAFEFPRRDPSRVFFPTVHIHDGQVHPVADFDHLLYAQPLADEHLDIGLWEQSWRPPRHFIDLQRAAGLVDPDLACYMSKIHGMATNEDRWI